MKRKLNTESVPKRCALQVSQSVQYERLESR